MPSCSNKQFDYPRDAASEAYLPRRSQHWCGIA